jgi:8-amino-7-oxononanoate synthase
MNSAAFDDWLSQELETLSRSGLRRSRRTVSTEPDGWCVVDGQRVRNLASNDYLNLAHDPRLRAAVEQALQSVGATASPLVSGRSTWHAALEAKIASFEGTEAALLFPTGYAANVGTLRALIGAGDAVFCDRLNHASLVDGCRQSDGRFRVYRHDDLETLARELKKSSPSGRRWIVTDSVFSMDGTIAPLSELADLAEQFDASMIVDEAHGTGVFGDSGRGVCQLAHVENRVSVRIGTLSKAVGVLGGFVAGSKPLIDWLWNSARTQMFSTALPPSLCAAACTAFTLMETEPDRRLRLLHSASRLREELVFQGVSVVPNSVGPIVPIVLGSPKAAVIAAERLLASGLLVPAIRPPTVPQGTSRLRMSLTAAFRPEEMPSIAATVAHCAT